MSLATLRHRFAPPTNGSSFTRFDEPLMWAIALLLSIGFEMVYNA